jgi:hypothetical protein
VCLESQVTEILREAGPEVGAILYPWYIKLIETCQGLHVNEIAAKNGMNVQKLGKTVPSARGNVH